MASLKISLASLLVAAAALPAIAQAPQTEEVAEQDNILVEDRVLLNADNAYVLENENLVVAEGNVRAEYEGRVLTADKLTYDRETGRVRAQGNIVITEPDGTERFAEEIETDSRLVDGFATGFSLRTPQGETAAANTAERRNETVTELDRAVFTACELCEGQTTPTWSIRARKAVLNEDTGMFTYRDAVFEIAGVPVVYFPYFSHPDPQSERRSGFLVPRFGASSKYGAFLQPRYYWAISDYQDLVVSPAFYTKIDPRLEFDYRKRFYSGDVNMNFSFTNEARFDDDGERLNNKAFRGHFFADGRFRISEDWDWGFAVEEASDDLYTDRYDVDGENDRRGIYYSQPKTLLSQLYTQGQAKNWYVDASIQTFDNLQAQGIAEDRIADVLPLINSQYDVDFGKYGYLSLTGSAAFLERVEGVDSRRATVGADWSTQRIIPGGLIVEPFAEARFDYYNINDFPTVDESNTITRGVGSTGVKLSMPFYRPGQTVDLLVEPIVMGAVSTGSPNDEPIPVEDGAFFELDTSSLFDANAQAGYDLYEGDKKLGAGISATARWKNGFEISGLVGRRWRSEADPAFDVPSNLDGTVSDWLVSTSVEFNDYFSIDTKLRLDDDSLDINRLDTALNVNFEDIARTKAIYYRIDESITRSGIRQEGLFLLGEVFVRDNILVLFELQREFEQNLNIRQGIGLAYEDECSRFELVYERQGTTNRELGPSESIVFRFGFKTIGELGSRNFD
ncbi:LPS assembly protein LptD [Henriciella sp.]|uniref:LPS-assembly protein LptD n=1 Tax=Henriciella sp. TaxID=1968823 RepID=UPI0017971C8F|nr:LPS assembly protein LptD [Henriciella sp.]HIG21463.1 LPS-assembly protein LptD [Henriciella sp.]